jgi:N-acetyl-anhydromuramyl-L-alanine amidase AmpD
MNPLETPYANPIVAVRALPRIAFVESKWYRRSVRRGVPLWIVIHCTEGHEGAGKAFDCAHELANIAPRDKGGNPRSTHLVIDSADCIQCVPFEREAYHCGTTGNIYGEGIELCGMAEQTRAEWLDAQSLPMLAIAAHVIKWRSDVLRLPLVHVTAEGLRAKQPGITTHADITAAFPRDTTHTDPGPNFPLAELLEAARAA